MNKAKVSWAYSKTTLHKIPLLMKVVLYQYKRFQSDNTNTFLFLIYYKLQSYTTKGIIRDLYKRYNCQLNGNHVSILVGFSMTRHSFWRLAMVLLSQIVKGLLQWPGWRVSLSFNALFDSFVCWSEVSRHNWMRVSVLQFAGAKISLVLVLNASDPVIAMLSLTCLGR